MDNEYVCKGSVVLGSGCGNCARCKREIYKINNHAEKPDGDQGRMPVGKKIEILIDHSGVSGWHIGICQYFGFYNGVLELSDGSEIIVNEKTKWRYHVDKEQQKRNEILESWRRLSLDNAHDSESSTAHIGSFLNMLIDKGYIEVYK